MVQSEIFSKNSLTDTNDSHWPQIIVILIASLGSFSQGALLCWPSPAIPILTSNDSHPNVITLEEASYFSVIPSLSSAVTSPFASILLDTIGRKETVVVAALPQFLSWILITSAEDIYVFYIARFCFGISEALMYASLPVYVSEIATPHVRGSWGSVISISNYVGQLMINVVSVFCNIQTTATIFASVPILHVILMAFIPQSPYFLLMNNQDKAARISLQQLRLKANVDEELTILRKDVHRQISESGTYIDLIYNSTNRKALLIAIALRGCQQLSGLTAFAVYTQYMFEKAGGNLSTSVSTIIFLIFQVVFVAIFAYTVDKLGRKNSMVFSCSACCIVLLIEATYFYIDQETTSNIDSIKWVPLAGMLTYIVVCSSGIGILPTLMAGELFSASIKSKALCILNICYCFYVLSISKVFQVLTHNYGLYVPFYLFSGCCLLGAIFSYYFVPETKGKTLEEIQQMLSKKKG